jgi:hypothetical protein
MISDERNKVSFSMTITVNQELGSEYIFSWHNKKNRAAL